MIKNLLFFCCILLPSLSFAQNISNTQLASYAIGLSFSEQLPKDVDIDYFVLALKDAKNQSIRFNKQQLNNAYLTYQQEKQGTHIISPQKNQQFLADNGKKSGIKTTASGLQYQILQEGQGKIPKPSSKVTVHYEGRLIDSSVFDSSYKRGEPTSFPLNMVIKGWTEGLQLIREGGKIRLFIPASLGYGKHEMPNIPPHSTLIFDVELLKVQ